MAREIELEVTAGRIVLAGTLTLPDGTADAPAVAATPSGPRLPAVLLLPSLLPRDRHGRYDRRRHRGWFGPVGAPSSGILARLSSALAARGVASLRYDKRGCGRSGGRWSDAGLFTLVDDARDALSALRGHRAVDPARIGIAGHGEGAWLALSVAAADPAVGPLTVIGAAARSLPDVLRRGVAERARRAARKPRDARHPFVSALDRSLEELLERAGRGEPSMTITLPGGRQAHLGLAAWEQALRTPGRALATLQRRSVTVVHGLRDAWVDPDESALLVDALPPTAAPCRLTVPGAGHDLAEAPPGLFADLAADLDARLQPRRLPTVLLAIADAPGPADERRTLR